MAKRRLNKRQTNMVLAGAMGFAFALAVAFFVVAMPGDVFEGLVLATGLPSVLAAAEPPLGETARLIAAIFTGGVAGAAILAAFLITGRQPRRKAEVIRPFSVSGDIVLELDQSLPADEPADISIPEHPEVQPIPVIIPKPVVTEKPIEIEIPADETPIFLDFKAIRAAAKPANDAPARDLSARKASEPEPKPKRSESPQPITPPAQIAGDEPISVLMQRLEAGLERRAARGEAPAQSPAINRSGVGLRSTLDELRKMAVRR